MLANIAHLNGSVFSHLLLEGKVPLLRHSRLDGVVPGQHGGANKWIAANHRAGDWACFRCERFSPSSCRIERLTLRWCIGWVLRQPQICSRAFQIRRDGVRTTNNSLMIENRRTPCEAEAPLKVRPSIGSIVQPSTEAIFAYTLHRRVAGIFELPCLDVDVYLPIVYFDPRSNGFVTQAEVQS